MTKGTAKLPCREYPAIAEYRLRIIRSQSPLLSQERAPAYSTNNNGGAETKLGQVAQYSPAAPLCLGQIDDVNAEIHSHTPISGCKTSVHTTTARP